MDRSTDSSENEKMHVWTKRVLILFYKTVLRIVSR